MHICVTLPLAICELILTICDMWTLGGFSKTVQKTKLYACSESECFTQFHEQKATGAGFLTYDRSKTNEWNRLNGRNYIIQQWVRLHLTSTFTEFTLASSFLLWGFSYFVQSECECPLMRTEQQITHYQSAEVKTNGPCRESRLLYRKRMILWIDSLDIYDKKHVDAE